MQICKICKVQHSIHSLQCHVVKIKCVSADICCKSAHLAWAGKSDLFAKQLCIFLQWRKRHSCRHSLCMSITLIWCVAVVVAVVAICKGNAVVHNFALIWSIARKTHQYKSELYNVHILHVAGKITPSGAALANNSTGLSTPITRH